MARQSVDEQANELRHAAELVKTWRSVDSVERAGVVRALRDAARRLESLDSEIDLIKEMQQS